MTRWQGIQCEVVLPTQEWLNITMDGFPYLVCREVIEDVLLCFKCGEEVEKACVTEYCIKAITGSSVVLHKNLTGHAIFIDLNWDIFLSKLASELGLVSENAQKYACFLSIQAWLHVFSISRHSSTLGNC